MQLTLKTPYLLINDHKTFQEHDIQAKSDNKNLGKMAKKKFSARLDSARDLFHFSSKVKMGQKRAENWPKMS